MKRSVGILVYKKENNKIKVLLCHPGGPFWENTHLHSWGIPKGEIENKERVVAAAIREFKEETNLDIDDSDLKYLASRKVSHHKLVIMFYQKQDFDLSNCYSNTFKKEWPLGSGVIGEFPENDKYAWVDIEEAFDLIFCNQVYFLKRLKTELNLT